MLHLHNKDLNFDGSRRRRRYTAEEYRATNLPPPEDSSWKALGDILSRPWFVRTWVIQEVAVSKVTPRVICGSHELACEHILRSEVWMASMCYNLTPFNLEITNMPALRSLKLFNELKNVGLPWDLTTLLKKAIRSKHRSRETECTRFLVWQEKLKMPHYYQQHFRQITKNQFEILSVM
jgi:hypothetical protein